jgi:hypothetical protein
MVEESLAEILILSKSYGRRIRDAIEQTQQHMKVTVQKGLIFS